MIVALRQRTLGVTMLLVAMIGIGVITLRPGTGTGSVHPLWCLSCLSLGSRAGTDLLLNTLLFVPLAFGLWHAGASRRRTMAIVVGTTVAIELLQMNVIPGRYASIGDLIANSLGGALGIALAPRWPMFIVPRRRTCLRLALLAALLWVALLGVSVFGLQPALPDSPYTVSWNPGQLPDRRLTGQVLSARVNGVSIEPGRYLPAHPLVTHLRARDARFDAVLLANGRSNERDSRVDIEDDEGTRIASLGQDDRDLLFRVRLRARDLRLRAPSARIADALPSKLDVRRTATSFTGDTIRIAGELAGSRMRVLAVVGGNRLEHELALGPELGWTFFLPYPADAPSWAILLLGALWLGAPLFPIGYWAGRRAAIVDAGDRSLVRTLSLSVALLVAAGLGLIPALTGSALVSPVGWLVAGACVGLGWVLGMRSARLGVAPRRVRASAVRLAET